MRLIDGMWTSGLSLTTNPPPWVLEEGELLGIPVLILGWDLSPFWYWRSLHRCLLGSLFLCPDLMEPLEGGARVQRAILPIALTCGL